MPKVLDFDEYDCPDAGLGPYVGREFDLSDPIPRGPHLDVFWSWNPLDWWIRRGMWPNASEVEFEWLHVGPLEIRWYRGAT